MYTIQVRWGRVTGWVRHGSYLVDSFARLAAWTTSPTGNGVFARASTPWGGDNLGRRSGGGFPNPGGTRTWASVVSSNRFPNNAVKPLAESPLPVRSAQKSACRSIPFSSPARQNNDVDGCEFAGAE